MLALCRRRITAVCAVHRLLARSLTSGCLRYARATFPQRRLDDAEVFYPLHVRLCDACLLVQLPAYVSGEHIFSDYAYFSSYSDSWVAHAKRYAEAMIGRLDLTPDSLVTEVASNDGYLLQHFQAAGIPVLGVEPAANVAEAARARGYPDGGSVPRRRDRPRDRAAARPGRPRGREQRLRSRAGHPGLRGRACAPWSRTRAW